MEVVQTSFWMDDLVTDERSIRSPFFYSCPRRPSWMIFKLDHFIIHYQLPPCPWVVQGNVQPDAILWMYVFMSAIRCAMCHDPIGDQSHRFIFSRSMPYVAFWLVVSFQMLKFVAYNQWNSSATLYISEISFFDIPCLSTSSRIFPRLQSPSVQIQVFSSFSSSGFKFS